MANRIIVPANYTFEVILKVDHRTGQSEMAVRNRSGLQFGSLQIAGLLMEHATNIMRTLLMQGKTQHEQIPQCTKCGIIHTGECETAPENKINGGEHAT